MLLCLFLVKFYYPLTNLCIFSDLCILKLCVTSIKIIPKCVHLAMLNMYRHVNIGEQYGFRRLSFLLNVHMKKMCLNKRVLKSLKVLKSKKVTG